MVIRSDNGRNRLEIAADGFRVEIEIIEVKSEQHVALLDVARAQNAVP